MKRFKIDVYDFHALPFALYVKRTKWHSRFTGSVSWKKVDIFQTRDDVKSHYEKIKDLPEYLD